ncbi:HAD family phosphatase [uncultured Acetobacteroides sp.]|uniref:HAD family hydrolase n=1 Tax=uncultured Acetobacteroides sp. TaxID=1760811 RepID=UPI0029F53B3B|nr:HAD family phosphatase [uncultured Acetobacteroides sp.]
MDFSAAKPVNTKAIRNIIFDFGGVIINIDYHLTAKAFEGLGVTNFKNLFSQASQSNLFDNLEIGAISPSEFRNELRRIINLDITDEQLDNAWNAMLLDYPKHRLAFLSMIKDRYRTFLLSNTNQIHMDCYYASLLKEHGINGLDSLFEKLYFSHEVGLRKPDPAIYQLVLDQNKLKAEETLFIDDSAQNLSTPNSLGIQVYHLTNGEDVVDFAQKYLSC